MSSSSKRDWLQKFRRVTASTRYLPEIDGLRFMAILMVAVWMHTTHFIDEKFFSNGLIKSRFWQNFIMEGGYGVAIFFMISGFILSLPFAQDHFDKRRNKKGISLKRYYLRRLIRLEPPYLIALIIFFIAHVWVLGKYSFNELLPHFFASAFYLHNTIYDSFSWVLPIAWSLEVEVQFYLLAPLLCCIYMIKSKALRWAILILFIIASGIYNYQFIIGTVVKFFCCFGIGMLITDFYCNKEKFVSSPKACFAIGILSLIIIIFVPTLTSQTGYWIKFLFTVIFLYTVLTNEKMKQIFSNKYIVVIGGMCYSIYLLHFGILSVLGKLLQSTGWNLSNLAYIPLYFILFSFSILTISAIYFLLVEKPFMKLTPKR